MTVLLLGSANSRVSQFLRLRQSVSSFGEGESVCSLQGYYGRSESMRGSALPHSQ